MAAFAAALAMAAPAQEPDHAIHEALRAILRGVEQAMNGGRYDAMRPLVSRRARSAPRSAG